MFFLRLKKNKKSGSAQHGRNQIAAVLPLIRICRRCFMTTSGLSVPRHWRSSVKIFPAAGERDGERDNFIHSKNRNRLLPTKVGKLLSVYANGRVVDRMKECEENGEEYVRARADALNLTRNSEELNWDQYREFDNGVSSSDEESI